MKQVDGNDIHYALILSKFIGTKHMLYFILLLVSENTFNFHKKYSETHAVFVFQPLLNTIGMRQRNVVKLPNKFHGNPFSGIMLLHTHTQIKEGIFILSLKRCETPRKGGARASQTSDTVVISPCIHDNFFCSCVRHAVYISSCRRPMPDSERTKCRKDWFCTCSNVLQPRYMYLWIMNWKAFNVL
jgi:hypothetical protein